jgi:small-conductance mechanosensitive channel
MSFREKTAWVTLIAIAVVSLMYLLHMPWPLDEHSDREMVHAMGASVAAYVLIEIVAYLVLRWRNPQDARLPKDERERLIDLTALRIAYYVLVVGMLGGMFVTLHLVGARHSTVSWMSFTAFVFAHTVKHAARIYYYRRGT